MSFLSNIRKATPRVIKDAYWKVDRLRRVLSEYQTHHEASRMVRQNAHFHRGQKFFVDLGFNKGTVSAHMAKNLGGDFNIIGFEVNELLFKHRAEALKARYPNVDLHFKAASDHNGTVEFYEEGPRKGPFVAEGTTIVDGLRTQSRAEKPQNIKSFDFSEWLKDLHEQQTISKFGYKISPYIAVKMDIEGAEYDVLEKVITDGHHPLISDLIVEFHANAFDMDKREEMLEREDNIRRALNSKGIRVLEWV
ncbi:MAG: hypothetical protein CL570_00445 [Alphaproteobacteria bacterium]|nr:hypothetical protein [Alphaproteobacteria bacterium]HCQ71730.1 hypothetical protein [Rhodospirillaceae bacterium]|tara:strand:+ start:1275 stop:2024 length:750 start_codon:yes stop_codon:yes gene_type:complete